MADNRRPDVLLLNVETTTGDATDRQALERAVENTLGRDAQGLKWKVVRLFSTSRPPNSLARYFRVSGHIDAPPQQFEGAAFDYARRLADASGFEVEPDLPSTNFAIPDFPVPELAPPRGAIFNTLFPSPAPLAGTDEKDWALSKIHALEAWEIDLPPGGKARGKDVVIAHPDTGYTDHPDMGLASYDFGKDRDILSNDDDALDPLDNIPLLPVFQPGHGTLTSSTLAGRLVTSIQGVAPEATVVPIRAMRSVAHFLNGDVARAVHHAIRQNADVISMSLGGLGFLGLSEVIDQAVSKGIIVLAAAGNYVDFVIEPASYRNCIAVAATNIEDEKWPFSATGAKVAVSAPGQDIWAPGWELRFLQSPRATLEPHSGTSFAVAHVAGVAALWLAFWGKKLLVERYRRENLQAAFLYMVKKHGSFRPNGWDAANMGVGIIDANALLSATLAPREEVLDAGPQEAIVTRAPMPFSVARLARDADGVVSQRIAAIFPDLSAEEIRAGLAVMLGEQDLREKVARYEAELAWIFSQRSAAREAFKVSVPRARGPRRGAAAEMALPSGTGQTTMPLSASIVGQFASPSLTVSLSSE